MASRLFRSAVLLVASASLGAQVAHAAAPARANPFAVPSTLPFQAPRFDLIKDSDYQPAFETAMAQHLAEVQKIANNPAAPTFDNTIAALEKSGRMLDRVSQAFFGVVQANTNDTLDKVQEAEAPKL
ncbi:MAG: dipeptidyl carboxypeptidase II, partial [Sphingomonas sp.]